MKKVEVKLEIITPMLSFGDNTNKAEFRIAELKSLMRSTFREIYSFNGLDDMKEKEDALFGNMKKKSPISFKIKSIEPKGEEKFFMLPHKEKEKDKSKTSCLGSSSEIVLYMITSNDSNIELYVNLLIQASIVGAMGKRSRKGFGSFRIIKVNGIEKYEDLLEKSPIKILEECENYLEDSDLYKIRENQYENSVIEVLAFSDSVLRKNELDFSYIKKINFIKIQKDREYDDLIESISRLTHDRLPSKKAEEDFIDSIVNKESINRNILGNCRFQSTSINRFASPIYASFWENAIDRYMIIKELNYDYILDDLKIKNDKSKKTNKEYVDKYIKELIKIGGAGR